MRQLLFFLLFASCTTCPTEWSGCQVDYRTFPIQDCVLKDLLDQKSNNPDFQIASAQVLISGSERASALDDLDSLRSGLTLEIASNYVQLRGLQERLNLLEQSISRQHDAVEFTKDLLTRGLVSTGDASLADAQLKTLLSQRPQLELGIDKIINRLTALLDYAPGELNCLRCPGFLPPLPEFSCCNGVACLPEVRKAQRDLILAKGGYVGPIDDIYTSCQRSCGKPYIAQRKQAYYSHQKALLKAEEDQQNAYDAIQLELERYQAILETKIAAQNVYDDTFDLYKRGLKNYFEMLSASQSLMSAQNELIQSHTELLLQSLLLNRACGN